MAETLLTFAVLVSETASVVIFLTTFLEIKLFRNRKLPSLVIVLLLTPVSYFLAMLLPENVIVKGVVFIALFFGFSCAFFNGKLINKLVFSSIIYFLILSVDFTVLQISMQMNNAVPYNEFYYNPFYSVYLVIGKVLILLVVFLIRKIWNARNRKNGEISLSALDWIMLVIIPVTSVASIQAFVYLYQNAVMAQAYVLFASVGVLANNFVFFYMLERTARRGQAEKENALLKQQKGILADDVKSMVAMHTKQTTLSHDYKNHIVTLRTLVDEKRFESASNYLHRLSVEAYHSVFRIHTNNEVVDAVLNLKENYAYMKACSLTIFSSDLSDLPMQEDDIVIVLANALDNAIEATEKCVDSREITLKLDYQDGQLWISVTNPVANDVAIWNGMIKTTKKDSDVHGIGLKSIFWALNKYNGSYELFCENKVFQFVALVPFS